MKIRIIIISALLMQCLGTFAQHLQHELKQLLKSELFETSTVGLLVYDLDADSVLFEHNSHQLLRPASTMKAITAITALDKLSANHLFTTSIYTTGKVRHGVLHGDLWCKGGMDPTFGAQQMDIFVEKLKQKRIHTIKGNISSDLSLKDSLIWGEGWCWDDENPALTPLLYNGEDIFVCALREKLAAEGIEVLGNDSTGIVPADAKFITNTVTTLPFVMMQMMKDSDNLYAESVYYQLGHSAREAQQQVREVLRKSGVEDGAYRLADGSGLSLYNYLSAYLEVRMLRYAYQHKDIFDTLYPTLPVSGVDGTLAKRMTSGPAYQQIHAKTGTVSGVSALAGYYTASNGHMIAFSIINQGVMQPSKARQWQDKVCEALTSNLTASPPLTPSPK